VRVGGGNGPRGEERVQRGAGLRRAGVLGRAREQARAAWARAGGGERELGLARVVCWASLSWVWILGSFPFPFLFPFLSTQNYLNSNEFEFKLLYKQTKQNHAPA